MRHVRMTPALAAGLLAAALVVAAIVAPAALAGSKERPNGGVETTCSQMTWFYKGFPAANNNKVLERIYIDGKIVSTMTFSFNGPSGSNTTTINVPAGRHKVDGKAKWNTNGFSGNWDIPAELTCTAAPAFTIEKRQGFALGGVLYTTAPLALGHVGEKVDYEIIVTNTGNVPLTFSNFTDPHCDEGTTSGGPGTNPVAPSAYTIYFCDHVLTLADLEAGTYTNAATVTGTPPEGDGPPITSTSNPVVVELPDPQGTTEFSCSQITFSFTGFPNVNNNTVTELVFIHGKLISTTTFTFNGPSGSNTVTFTAPPGQYKIDGKAKWNTNGFKDGFDHFVQTTCQ